MSKKTYNFMPKVKQYDMKNGVVLESNLDRTLFSLERLILEANHTTAKFIRRAILKNIRKSPSMTGGVNRSSVGKLSSKRIYGAFQYWVRKLENDLIIGIKHNTWYGVQQELGTRNQPHRQILRNTVLENIPQIQQIQMTYLGYMEDEEKIMKIVNGSGNDSFLTSDGDDNEQNI